MDRRRHITAPGATAAVAACSGRTPGDRRGGSTADLGELCTDAVTDVDGEGLAEPLTAGPDRPWRTAGHAGTPVAKRLRRARSGSDTTGPRPRRDRRRFDVEGGVGRIRTAVTGPDDRFRAVTSNRDGRGQPVEGDDPVTRCLPAR
ncbi:hypothetical protein [Haloplanus sp.]|uniref:hypothetical protein n=1 Tax=Haloplanus sp. TaxID=1961696 RepID=UPI0026272545|nr:hypothetical protein [Haloplanus sp.]